MNGETEPQTGPARKWIIFLVFAAAVAAALWLWMYRLGTYHFAEVEKGVLYRDGKYHCLYSGGAWHSENYGIGFATASDPLGPWVDDMAVHGPTVLKGAPPKVVGPGHNSVVLGPDDRTLFCVYHAWDEGHTARRMCIDPLIWTETGPKCDGPSTTPRTLPR